MQGLNGFVKIHRKLIQWGWYQDNVVKGVFLHLLLTANFKDSPWRGRIIKRGQVVIGTIKMAEDLGFTRQQIRTAIDKLKSTNEITTETTNKFTIVTIVNWEDYQVLGDETTSKATNETTNKGEEQPADYVTKVLTSLERVKNSTNKITNKKELESLVSSEIEEIKNILATSTLTNEQPTNNQQITNKQPQRKNDKNYKKEKKKEIEPPPSSLLGEESAAERARRIAELRE